MAQKSNQVASEAELKLRWYFGGRGNIYQSSIAGNELDWFNSANKARMKCPVCDGDGFLYCGTARAKPCPRCNGGGEIDRDVHGKMVPRSGYVSCGECHGVVGLNPDCGFCHGAGYASVWAAFCRHEDKAVLYVDADAAMFVRQGEIGRAMSKVDDALKACAERYYGPEGDRWARTSRGRIFSLYDFTAAGRRLLSKSPRAHRKLTALERIGMLAESDLKFQERERTELLANAFLQAKELIEQFETTWAAVTGGDDGTT